MVVFISLVLSFFFQFSLAAYDYHAQLFMIVPFTGITSPTK